MIFSKDADIRMYVELSYDSLSYHPLIEFNKKAMFEVLSNGGTETEFILRTLNSCKELINTTDIKNIRVRYQVNNEQFYFFGKCPFSNYNEANLILHENEKLIQRMLFEKLTTKEIEVLKFISNEKDKKNVTSKLKIQISTFNLHIKNIYKKLGVHSLHELRQWCDKYLNSM